MKIEKFIKIKKNQYKLFLENKRTITLYDEVILKYDLLLSKEIKDIDKLLEENKYYECYDISLKYISKRIRTKKELIHYLKEYDKDIVEKIIIRLEKENYLNENVYISSYIHDEITLKITGKDKIIKDLLTLGLQEENILKEINKLDDDIFIDKINNYIKKKLNVNKSISKKMFINKITLDLINKGFNRNDIMNCLENISFKEDNSILEKEYHKLYKKYSNKYDENKLNSVIQNKLYQKGYELDKIRKVMEMN